MREYSDVVIIGAGAAGMLCGGLLAEEGISVTILEKNDRVGKKLSATGNGRCNYTNRNMSAEKYYGDASWIRDVLSRVDTEDILRLFRELGVYPRERDGYIYPYTNQSSTVVHALQSFCRLHAVDILLDCKAKAIRKKETEFVVQTREGGIACRCVVLASGGKACEELGGDGSGYKLARSLGHSIHTIFPGLTGLVCSGDFWKQVAGTRIQGKFSLLIDHRLTEGETGEIQVVKEGLSGIPVFQMCRLAAYALSRGKCVEAVVDFVPPMSREEVRRWLEDHGPEGLVPKKWIPVLKRMDMGQALKEFRVPVERTFGMERAQVTAGGVDTGQVESGTMASTMESGVYFAGEILDVDGRCGGYNLHFAWASAILAARDIKRRFFSDN